MPAANKNPVLDQVLEALGQAQDSLHELDYEDVALSAAGLKLVRQAAALVMQRLTGMADEDLPASRALALFLDHVFWNEATGGLILCAQITDRSVCLPIPPECWGLKPHFGRIQ